MNATDNRGSTPMHMAAEKGHLEVVQALRAAGEFGGTFRVPSSGNVERCVWQGTSCMLRR